MYVSDSISAFSFPQDLSNYTEKQKEQLHHCWNTLNQNGIKIIVNEIPNFANEEVVCDVEHDEQGSFVCLGLSEIGSNNIYCIYDFSFCNSIAFYTFSLIGHNFKTDLELLQQWGLDVSKYNLFWDTQLYHHILDSAYPEYGLKYLADKFCNISYPSYDDIVGKKTLKQSQPRITLDKQPKDLVILYNACDILATKKLYEYQKTKTTNRDTEYFLDLEHPCGFIFSNMESRGIRIDLPYLRQLREQLENQLTPKKQALLNQLGNINLESPKQLLEALKNKGVTPKWRGKDCTDKRALEYLKNILLIQELLDYRELETLLATFIYPYLERNQEYIHPFFNQCGTRTGRLSCSNPNLLQIPKRTENGKLVRKMFISRSGMELGDCDFGQIEPRVLAHFSKDPNLLELFNSGTDFHEFTAQRLGISRERAKILNLSVGYRATWKSVAQQLKIGQYEAQKEIDKWWELFPTLRRYEDKQIYESKRSDFITTLMGRRIKVKGLSDSNPFRREAAERQLINNLIQGSAAEIMKMAMVAISTSKRYSSQFGLLVQIYDELLAESQNMTEDLSLMKQDMENCIKLDVPLVVDAKMGANWAEIH